jgi:hypothetical protein
VGERPRARVKLCPRDWALLLVSEIVELQHDTTSDGGPTAWFRQPSGLAAGYKALGTRIPVAEVDVSKLSEGREKNQAAPALSD